MRADVSMAFFFPNPFLFVFFPFPFLSFRFVLFRLVSIVWLEAPEAPGVWRRRASGDAGRLEAPGTRNQTIDSKEKQKETKSKETNNFTKRKQKDKKGKGKEMKSKGKGKTYFLKEIF